VAAITVLVAAGLLVLATQGSAASIVAAGVAIAAVPIAMLTSGRRHSAFGAVIAAAGALVAAFVIAGGDHMTQR
jgi:hypothetical protein